MDITLSTDQYKSLVQIIYLGLIQMDIGGSDDQRNAAFEVEEFLYSYHSEFKLDNYFNLTEEGICPSKNMHSDMQKISIKYDEDSFWSMLVIKLAEKEISSIYAQNDLDNMTDFEKEELVSNARRKYYKEFNDNGLKNISCDI